MNVYEVGKRFPHEKYLTGREITVALPVGQFFDVLCCIQKPEDKEIAKFKQGRLAVSLFERYDIPFVVFDFGGGFNFDVSLDATKVVKEEPDWMKEEANVVNVFLVDSRMGILKATRMIGLSEMFCEKIRDIVAKQLARKSTTSVDNDIQAIYRVLSTEDMINRAIDRCTFK
jgi:hypothetical protein